MSETPEAPIKTPTREMPATKGDVDKAALSERVTTILSSGFTVVVSVSTFAAMLLGGSWVVIDRADAAGRGAGEQAAKDLRTEFKAHEAAFKNHEHIENDHHEWTEKMLLRLDDKLDAQIQRQGGRNPWPDPPPAPPPFRDGGP